MQQLDLFTNSDTLIWEEIKSLQKSIKGLYARYNYLEREWIANQTEKHDKKSEKYYSSLDDSK